MTAHRATITLEDEAYKFLLSKGGNNRSSYINQLLIKEKLNSLADAMLKANQEEANDIEYQNDISVWDVTMSDGLGSECTDN
jgi:predicted CopG family antitoxin